MGSRTCILKVKTKDRSLCLLQVYTPKTVSQYQAIVDDFNNVLERIGSTESVILLGNFNADIRTESET